MVAAAIRTVFAQPTAVAAHAQWRRVAAGFRSQHPRLAALLDEAEPDGPNFLAFPAEHWRQVWSTTPLERVHKAVRRRTDAVGGFPDRATVVRLTGMPPAEQHDERQAGRRCFSPEPHALSTLGGTRMLPASKRPPPPVSGLKGGGINREAAAPRQSGGLGGGLGPPPRSVAPPLPSQG